MHVFFLVIDTRAIPGLVIFHYIQLVDHFEFLNYFPK